MTTIELLNTVKSDNVHAFFVIFDRYDGTDDDVKFLNNPVGRAAAAKFYDELKAPFKKITYETATADIDLIKYTDTDFWAAIAA